MGSIATSIAQLADELAEKVEEITASTFSAVERWLTHGWVPKVHELPESEHSPPEVLAELVHYYRRKRLDLQVEYLGQATHRNFLCDLHTKLAGPAMFFGSVFFALMHVAVFWGARGHDIWTTRLILAAIALPVLGAGFRTLRTANEYTRNASRFEATRDALSVLSQRLREATDGPAIFRELGFCEQVLESDLREWMRLMVEAEWFG